MDANCYENKMASYWSFITVTCMMKRCPTNAVGAIYCQSVLHGKVEITAKDEPFLISSLTIYVCVGHVVCYSITVDHGVAVFYL